MVRKNTGRRVAAFAISGVAAVGVLAGCGSHSAGEASSSAGSAGGASASEPGGGGSGDGQSAVAVQSAYRKTADARTAKMTMSTTVGGTDGGGTTIRGSGVIDLASGASDLHMSVQGQQTEERTVDGVLYEKLPASAAKKLLPSGKTWVRIDLKKVAGGAGDSAGGMTRMVDPAAPFSYVKGLSGRNVTKVGTETVNGTKTTHYKVSVDVGKLAKDSSAQARRLKQQLGDKLPVDLWLDGQGRIRQEEVKAAARTGMPMSPGAGGGSSASQSPPAGSGAGGSAAPKRIALDSKIQFTDFGTKADVTAPPAAKTADMTGKIAQGADTGASGGDAA